MGAMIGGPQLSLSHPRASAVSRVTHLVHSFVLRLLFPKSLVALQIFKIWTVINTLLWVRFSAGRLSHAMGHRMVWFDARRGAPVGKECWKKGRRMLETESKLLGPLTSLGS